MNLIYCFQSEWLKKKRSLASWLIITGAFFTPAIIFIAKLVRSSQLIKAGAAPDYWQSLWKSSWESMAIFLLPMGAILATSLIVQLEYKNNTWKQLHTTPQRLTTLFFAKFLVILVMMLQFFALFNVGIYLAGILPYLVTGNSLPKAPVPVLFFLRDDSTYFLACLPIIALQYLVSIKFKNFLVPVGGGFLLWVAALAVLNWQYGFLNPYTYCAAYYLAGNGKMHSPLHGQWLALSFFTLFTLAGYVLYLIKKEKG